MKLGHSFMTLAAVLLPSAAALGAQQPAAPAAPLTAVTAARDTTQVLLDRIVAVVGDQPITQYDVQERILSMGQQPGFKPPSNQAEYDKLSADVVNQLVDEELLVQKAKLMKIEVTDQEVATGVDRQVREIRSRFSSDAEFRAELAKAGLGSAEEYRRFLSDQMRRNELQRRVIEKMRQDGKIPPVNVSEADVQEAFNRTRTTLPRRPATVTFRQIVVAPKATDAAKATARAKAESLLVEIKAGGDFERIAKRESMDSISAQQGGDLGWNGRGTMVPEFEKWMFGLRPGDLSPVIETVHGFHIIRVDRSKPGEVKARHILIRPKIDAADEARARAEADSVAAQWTAGASFDSLARQHHDYASGEETSILTAIPRDSMPATYQRAFASKKTGDVVVFEIPGLAGHPKYVVARLASSEEGGEYKLSDLRDRVRQQLVEEGSIRRFLDSLRKEAYVSIRLGAAAPAKSG